MMRVPVPKQLLRPHCETQPGGATARVTLSIDLEKITDNTRRVVDALGGLHVVGVTKVTGGTPEVGRAAGIAAPIWL
jgi:predicted amino acid racemase